MAGINRGPGAFSLTPHKVSVCILVQIYASPAHISLPFPFSSVSQHNRLGLYLLALTKSCDDVFEPKLEKLIGQLREIGDEMDEWLTEHLTNRLLSLSSPDDLVNFFNETRGILGGVLDDDQIVLDPNSNLGMFVRRCILAFNLLSFEGVCHLLANIGIYCKDAHSSSSAYNEKMELENYVTNKVTEKMEVEEKASENVSFHLFTPKAHSGIIKDVHVSQELKRRTTERRKEPAVLAHGSADVGQNIELDETLFLGTNWQIQGYLREQADAFETHAGLTSSSSFQVILKHLQKLAPEFHRVHFLRYLNKLYQDDYFAALDSLLCYFDYSAGTEGFGLVPPSAGCIMYGRYEVALLCLGMMHFHFGHPKQALEVLTEAVRVSQQQSNDTILAYTLAAMSNLLSEIGIASTTCVLGSSYTPVSSIGSSLSVQQQLYVLLKGSLRRAESLQLKRLIASNHFAMAKFELTHVQRPLLSFGPKASMRLKTNPVSVCKELRLGSHLISEFCSENATMTVDGALSSTWLKDLQKSMGSSMFSKDSGSGNHFFQVYAQTVSIPRSVLQVIGSSYLLRATSWEIYGSAPLAQMNSLVCATLFGDASSASDAVLAHLKLIQYLAMYKGYKDAFAALVIAEEKYLSVSKSRLLLLKLQLLHEHALHRGNMKLAQRICDELGGLASSVTGVDMDLKVESQLRHARTLLATNEYSQAAAVAHSLFCMCYNFNLQVEKASVLLLLAEIHKKSGNPVLGLPYALASLSFCQSFNLDLLKASATLTLSELWLALGPNHAKRALHLLHGAFPMILGHGGLELCARAHIAEAKCYLTEPSYSVSEDYEVVLDSLIQASDELQALEYHELAAEAFYLMAIVYDKIGQVKEREEAASSFKKHIMALENSPNSFCLKADL